MTVVESIYEYSIIYEALVNPNETVEQIVVLIGLLRKGVIRYI
jgi:hypothetical protein